MRKHFAFNELADNVPNHNVAFLDARRIGGGHIEQDIGKIFHFAAFAILLGCCRKWIMGGQEEMSEGGRALKKHGKMTMDIGKQHLKKR